MGVSSCDSPTSLPHFHFGDGRCLFVLMAFNIFFIFIFQRNSTKPKVDRKTGSNIEARGQSYNYFKSNLSGSTRNVLPWVEGESQRSHGWGGLANGGPPGPTSTQTPPTGTDKALLHLCWGRCQRNKQPDPLKSLRSLAVTWAALGYFCLELVVLKGPVF